MPMEGEGGGDVDSIHVFIRVRPPAESQVDSCHAVCVETHANKRVVTMPCKPEPKIFTFDQVIDTDATQEGVFEAVGKSLIESCISGYNGTIFAYGQTGSGKTFTMLGPAEEAETNFQHPMRGVIPRSLDYLFSLINDHIEQHDDIEFLCKVSFLEIYNEQLYDLLDPVGAASTVLQLREDLRQGVFVEGQREQVITNAAEAYQVLSVGWLNRTVAETSMNRESSRSHAVFTVCIESKMTKDGLVSVRSSQLNLVDLAGSERQRDTHTTGLRLKEAGKINKSLSALGNVIMALGDVGHGKTRHVPYRNSKLSFLLRDSLGGNAKTNIVACVHPGSKSFGETLSTLQFARRAKMIKNKAVVNEDSQGNVDALKAELRHLKELVTQLQQGIPCTVSAIDTPDQLGEEEAQPGEVLGGDGMVWRKRFLQAMLLRKQADEDKQILNEKQRHSEQLCNSKEQALKQTRLVLKFREEALRRLTSASKEQRSLLDQEAQSVVDTLRGEVKALETLILNHPDVLKLNTECRALESEVSRLKDSRQDIDVGLAQKAAMLEKYFTELQTEKDKEDAHERRLSQCAPQGQETITAASLERTKAQLAKALTSHEQALSEVEKEKEKLQQQVVELTADAASLRTTNEELNKTLRANHLRIQIERDTAEERHMETIKIMTTPQRDHSALRGNRTPSVSSPIPILRAEDLSSPVSSLISAEAMPIELVEEKMAALNEEIRRLNEEKEGFRMEIETAHEEQMRAGAEHSRLATQLTELNKILEGERSNWTSEKKDLREEVEAHHTELLEAQNSKELCMDEIMDLRVMLTQLEKSDKEHRKTEKEHKQRMAELQTKILQLKVQISTQEKSLNSLQTENSELREREETTQSTLSYTEDKLASTETLLQQETAAKHQLLDKINELEEQLSHVHKQLTCMKEEGSKVEQQVLDALSQVEHHRGEARTFQQKLHDTQTTLNTSQITIGQLEECVEKESKLTANLKDVNGQLQDEVQRSRDQMQQQGGELEAVRNQVEEQTMELDQMQKKLHSLEGILEETNTKLTESHGQLLHKDFEMNNLQEDVASLLEENKSSLECYSSLQTEHNSLKELYESTSLQREQLDSELSALRGDYGDMKVKLEHAEEVKKLAAEAQQKIGLQEVNLQYLQEKIMSLLSQREEVDHKLHLLQTAYDQISSQLQDERDRNQELKEQMKGAVCDLNEVKDFKDKLQSQLEIQQKLQITLEEEHGEKLESAKQEADNMMTQLSQVKTDHQESLERYTSLQSQHTCLQDIHDSISKERDLLKEERDSRLTDYGDVIAKLEQAKKTIDHLGNSHQRAEQQEEELGHLKSARDEIAKQLEGERSRLKMMEEKQMEIDCDFNRVTEDNQKLLSQLETQENLTTAIRTEYEEKLLRAEEASTSLIQQAVVEKETQLLEARNQLAIGQMQAQGMALEKNTLLDQTQKHAAQIATLEVRCKELEGINAVLSGHANHNQKISYMQKLQADYEAVKMTSKHYQIQSEKLQREVDRLNLLITSADPSRKPCTNYDLTAKVKVKHDSGLAKTTVLSQNKENLPESHTD